MAGNIAPECHKQMAQKGDCDEREIWPNYVRRSSRMRRLWLNAALVALFLSVTALAFSAYLRPGMIIEFASLVLCS